MKHTTVALNILGLMMALPVALGASSEGGWLRHVPANARQRTNPLKDDAEASTAGAKLFRHDCASCHGTDARGRGSRPGLSSDRIHNATDGELEWLLTNGNLAHGMPSWSRLPEAQRWQLVQYLRTLPDNP